MDSNNHFDWNANFKGKLICKLKLIDEYNKKNYVLNMKHFQYFSVKLVNYGFDRAFQFNWMYKNNGSNETLAEYGSGKSESGM